MDTVARVEVATPCRGATVAAAVAKNLGEEAGDEGFEGRQGGADDADVHFDTGPVGCGSVVPGYVFGNRDDIEGAETEDGDKADALVDKSVVIRVMDRGCSLTIHQGQKRP